MNYKEEAIIRLEECIADCTSGEDDIYKSAFAIAIEALEKQLPKTPLLRPKVGQSKIEEGDFRYVDCPNCKQKIFSGFHFLPWNEAQIKHAYCINCGQAIDWEN